MNVAMFYHSLCSDWNHGNAHFLRGITWELKQRGHEVKVFEPEESWSLANLLRDHGDAPLAAFRGAYPGLESRRYRLAEFDLDEALGDADLAIVHEWNDPALVRRIGAHRKEIGGYRLLFHDTHHRSVSAPHEIAAYDLTGYDGVLAYGRAIADVYGKNRWASRVWVWHEAADTRVFRPLPNRQKLLDLVWIGNWGDKERAEELSEFLLRPAKALKLKAAVYGVRYPESALNALHDAGIEYRGWLANFRAPEIFASARATVHVPRRPYAELLPGIPTIRPFEALACAVPLVCAPWHDSENLFTPGEDYLIAHNGAEMASHLAMIYTQPERALDLARHGRQTVLERHSCGHRLDELLKIYQEIEASQPAGCAVNVSDTRIPP
jgi:spore maturation protein CgeB